MGLVKTRWLTEMQKHQRVKAGIKPPMGKVWSSCSHVLCVFATEAPCKEQRDDPHAFRDMRITILTR